MKKKTKAQFTVTMFNMSTYEQWQSGIRNRNYFVLRDLLKRDDIVHITAIDYIPFTKKQRAKQLHNRIKNFSLSLKNPIRKKIEQKLTLYRFLGVPSKKAVQSLSMEVKTNRNVKKIVWSYYPLYIDYFDYLPCEVKLFDAVDDWSEHPSYKDYQSILRNNYQKITHEADIIFTVTDYLKKRLFNNQKNVFHIPNGVDYSFFKKRKSTFKFHRSRPTIGYVGTIQSRVDFDLVKYVAMKHPDKNFAFVGPLWKDAKIDEVKDLKNVFFTGRAHYNDLPRYFSRFDIGIIPHTIDLFTKSMNPMKFYEYCAWGLPVVSTHQIANDNNLLYYAPDYDDFSNAIQKALDENTENLILRRQEYAQRNSWTKRVEVMMRKIFTHTIMSKI